MIAYIIVSELVYLWQHYAAFSFVATLAGFSVLVGAFMALDVRREKMQRRHLPVKRGAG